nr:hypothetical protein HK105_000821 [Polyrhizophydium stewartii]
MASTAAGVAVGSAVGHTIGAGLSGLFGGGSSQPQQVQPPPAPAQQYQAQPGYGVCEADQRAFNRCLEVNNDVNACQHYFDLLKQCRATAASTM